MVADLYLYSALFLLLIIEICVHVVWALRTTVLTSFLFDLTYIVLTIGDKNCHNCIDWRIISY